MVTPLMKILIAVVLIYLLITIFLKITKWTLRILIIALIIGIFIFGYTTVSDILENPPSEKLKEFSEENLSEEQQMEDINQELEDMEIEIEKIENEIETSEDNITKIEINITEE